MFFLRRLKPGLPKGIKYSARERFVRTFLMGLCIMVVCWGFWENSNRYVRKFTNEARISDASNLLDYKIKERAAEIMNRIEKKYGIKIHIKLSPLPVVQSDAVPDSLLIGLSPGSRQFELFMPAAWHDSLGLEFLLQLRDEIMAKAFAENTWGAGLVAVLEKLEQRMGELVSGKS